MGRYEIEEIDIEAEDQLFEANKRRFAKSEADAPKRSPIRRKDKWRKEEELKPKARRSHKRIQLRLKYDWQGE